MLYRTEIEIPADRYVCLLLPDFIPEGAAIVTVTTPDRAGPPESRPDDEADARDIEWWDEFDGDDPRRDAR